MRTSKVEGIKRGPTTGAAPSELLANIELDAPAVRRPVSSLPSSWTSVCWACLSSSSDSSLTRSPLSFASDWTPWNLGFFWGGKYFADKKCLVNYSSRTRKKLFHFLVEFWKYRSNPCLISSLPQKKLSRFGLKPQPFHLPSGRHPVFEYGEHDEPPTTCKNGPETPNHDLCEHARCRTVSLSSKDSGSIAAMVTSNDDLNSSAKPFWRFGRQNLP